MEARVNQLGKKISTRGVNLGKIVHSDLKMLVDNAAADSQENSFQNLFWKEQKKYFGLACNILQKEKYSQRIHMGKSKPHRLRVSISLLELSLLAFDKS